MSEVKKTKGKPKKDILPISGPNMDRENNVRDGKKFPTSAAVKII